MANPMYVSDDRKDAYRDIVIGEILNLNGRDYVDTAYDLGCGTGVYVGGLIANGIPTIGIDIEQDLLSEALRAPIDNIVFADLTEDVRSRFPPRDLVVSIEVAEHIAPERAYLFLQNIVALSRKWIFMTASNEVSAWHLNPQPLDTWVEQIEAFGTHAYQSDLSEAARQRFRTTITLEELIWFKYNLMIFKRCS